MFTFIYICCVGLLFYFVRWWSLIAGLRSNSVGSLHLRFVCWHVCALLCWGGMLSYLLLITAFTTRESFAVCQCSCCQAIAALTIIRKMKCSDNTFLTYPCLEGFSCSSQKKIIYIYVYIMPMAYCTWWETRCAGAGGRPRPSVGT